jgi:hypothetical protein
MNNKNLGWIVAAGLILSGCSTLESVPVNRSKPEDLRSQLAVGETVSIRLYTGERHQFRIVALESDTMVGRDQRIAYRDIDLIDVESVDYARPAKTALALGALAVVVIGVAILEAELDDEYLSDAPCRTNGSGGMICKPK